MGSDTTRQRASDALHEDLCAAINELAQSVDVAVRRIILRNKFNAAIADAAQAECAAEALRTAAIEPTVVEHESVTLIPRSAAPDARESSMAEPVDDLHNACTWLIASQEPCLAPKSNEESAIAMRILELSERLGGWIKSPTKS